MDLNIVQAVFYKAGHIQISDNVILVSDNPGIIMLKMENDKVTEISVSDSNRELGKFHMSVSDRFEKDNNNFTAVWNENEGLTHISVDLPKTFYAGSSVTIKFD
jgi:chondroitin AC lyase